jgi:hypothetical protein
MLLRSIAQETAPSVEAIKALAALRTEMAARREFYGKNWRLSLLTPEEWKEYTLTRNTNKFLDTLDPERLEIAAEYEREAYEAIRPKIGDACPNEMCVDGKVLMRAWTKNGVKCADYDDCRLCNGRGTIMAALGFSIDIWEGVEYQPDEHDPLFSDNFWVLDFEDLSV